MLDKRKQDVIAAMFLPADVTMIFTQMTGVVANVILLLAGFVSKVNIRTGILSQSSRKH